MSWGTDFTPDVFLSRKKYSNKGILEDDIKELEQDIFSLEKKLNMYATISPRDFEYDKESYDNVVDAISYEMDATLEWYNNDMRELFMLELYLKHINDNDIDLDKQNHEDN